MEELGGAAGVKAKMEAVIKDYCTRNHLGSDMCAELLAVANHNIDKKTDWD